MSADGIGDLLEEGAILRVSADADAARSDLDAARAHLRSAEMVSSVDPIGAFSLAYDALRKAIAAHMRAKGFRVRSGVGAHVQTGRYGQAALSGKGVDAALAEFDTVRLLRNRSEYRGALVKEADVAEAIAYARAIIDVAGTELE